MFLSHSEVTIKTSNKKMFVVYFTPPRLGVVYTVILMTDPVKVEGSDTHSLFETGELIQSSVSQMQFRQKIFKDDTIKKTKLCENVSTVRRTRQAPIHPSASTASEQRASQSKASSCVLTD